MDFNFQEHQGNLRLYGSNYSDTVQGIKSPDSHWSTVKFSSSTNKETLQDTSSENFLYERVSFGDSKS